MNYYKFPIAILIIILSVSTLFAQNSTPITLTLEEAIEIALEQSYNMKVLRLSVLRAQESLIAAKGRFRHSSVNGF